MDSRALFISVLVPFGQQHAADRDLGALHGANDKRGKHGAARGQHGLSHDAGGRRIAVDGAPPRLAAQCRHGYAEQFGSGSIAVQDFTAGGVYRQAGLNQCCER